MNVQCDFSFLQTSRQVFLKELTILFCSYDLNALAPHLADDIEWQLVGDSPIMGKVSFLEALATMQSNPAKELRIQGITVQGNTGAIHGTMTMGNDQVFSFADFYTFSAESEAKVKRITSYVSNLTPDK
ncbi:MAG: nuclear transport factor 2 family protein [Bacteroidota bacterium]